MTLLCSLGNKNRIAAIKAALALEGLADRHPLSLSGGERQRITIARAMLKPSSVVILDEATAYADPENEALIQQAISKLVAGKTLIVVAHRLNTIRNADQILVVANGNIAGRGTQEELLRECPIYQKMWQDYAGTIEEADLKGGVENHA